MSASVSLGYWKAVQEALRRHGIDPGPVDGVRGAMTDGALIRFKAQHGLASRPYIGPRTEALLFAEPRGVDASLAWPPWLRVAYAYLGLKEIPGRRHNPRILAWWDEIGAGWFDDDETPWCGAFVGGVLLESGAAILSGSEAPRARAWERWGQPLSGPAVGAVVTLWRGSRKSGSGHVFFCLGKRDGRLVGIGGNQSDAVTVANFDTDRATAFRWPTEAPVPTAVGMDRLPTVDRAGHRSTNEA